MEDLPADDYRALGQFRYQIRRFLHFSEDAARAEGLEPQQHQMMLAIRAWGGNGGSPEPTISDLAEHLVLKHHSAVGLLDRLEERGMAQRVRSDADRRQVRVRLTPEGVAKLNRLASAHRRELQNSGPQLVETLKSLILER